MTDLQSVANAQNPREKSGLAISVAQKVATDTAENGGERLISRAETDHELARLVSAWPKLSEGVRRAVMALAERTLPKAVEVAMLALLECGK